MKIGLLVDGRAERASLPALTAQVEKATRHTILKPLLSSIHPKAPVEQIAAICVSDLKILKQKGVDRVLVLVDREDRIECPGILAAMIEAAIRKRTTIAVMVVVKNRCFENWLVSDVSAIAAQPGRFRLTKGHEADVREDRADHLDAAKVLKASALRVPYNKVRDSERILGRSDIGRMAEGSRSFRRFLRCLGHPMYAEQSNRPVRLAE